MDASAIIVKIIGLVLFLITVRSVYKHFKDKLFKRSSNTKEQPPSTDKQQHSKAEQALNAVLLYAWFIFMTALSLGMIVNN